MSKRINKLLKKESLRQAEMSSLRVRLVFETLIFLIVFGVLQYALYTFFAASVPYKVRSANPDNSYEIELLVDDVYVKHMPPHRMIMIVSGKKQYKLDISPLIGQNLGLSFDELVSQLKSQDKYKAVIKNDRSIVALSDAEKTYLTLEEYNDWNKKQSTTGYLVAIPFELILIGFAAFSGIFIYGHFSILCTLKLESKEFKRQLAQEELQK